MFFGGLMLFPAGQRPNLIRTPLRDEGMNGTSRLVLDTFIFHVFILMNLFNSFNCRVISIAQLNVFESLFNNFMFIFIVIAEFCFQQWMVNCGSTTMTIQSALLGTGEITRTMNIVAWVLGATSLPIGIAAKTLDRTTFKFTDSKWW